MVPLKAAIVGNPEGWHAERLTAALEARGLTVQRLPATRLTGRVGSSESASFPSWAASRGHSLADVDLVFVRAVPAGSLEQIIFRLDVLHLLERRGKLVLNGPGALERSVDKYAASLLFEEAGLPTPETRVTERLDEAMEAFLALGGDVVVKPLFGSEGRGMVRLDDEEAAWRFFRVLDEGRYVHYIQRFIAHGEEDYRLFVVDGRVEGAMVRRAQGWRTNIARGARGEAFEPDATMRDMALMAAEAVGAFYAGVDILRGAEGLFVIEANGIPGWKGLEAATGIDMAPVIVDRALATLGENRP
jgi:RimK family alpha-L-glutamate ligase